jgi:cell division protein ZapA
MSEAERKDRRVTNVTIFGREYPLASDESPEYTLRVADYVDRKMSEIASAQNLGDPTKVAIMTALDIADQLLQRKEGRETDRARAEDALRKLSRYLDGASGGGDEQTPG